MQPQFRLLLVAGLLLIPVLLLLAADRLHKSPSRQPMADRTVPVRFKRIDVPGTAGAWAVIADDPRFGGLSAIALAGSRLLALTDSGVVVLMPKPGQGTSAWLHDLPAGPGLPTRRRWRDSEALLRNPEGGWLISFENRHSLWRYDARFTQGKKVADLRGAGWQLNKGVEAMVRHEDGTLLLPEAAGPALQVNGAKFRRAPLARGNGGIADALRLEDGQVLLLVRQIGVTGIRNWLARLVRSGRGYRWQPLVRIPVGPLTNLEGIAAEPLPNGGTRLWLVSDNDFADWRSTVLLAIDVPQDTKARSRRKPG